MLINHLPDPTVNGLRRFITFQIDFGLGVVNMTRVTGDKFKNRKRLKVHAVHPTARSWNSRAASVVCIGARST